MAVAPKGSVTAQKLKSDPDLNSLRLPWQPFEPSIVVRGAATGELLIRWKRPPESAAPRRWLELPSTSLPRATLYRWTPDGELLSQTSGDLVPLDARATQGLVPIFAVDSHAVHASTWVMVLELDRDRTPLIFELSDRANETRKRDLQLTLGAFLGVSLTLVIIAALVTVTLRRATIGIYTLWAGLVVLSVVASSGMGRVYLWPDSAGLTLRVLLVIEPLVSLCWSALLLLATGLHTRSRGRTVLLAGCVASAAAALGLALIGSGSMQARMMAHALVLVAALAQIYLLVWAIRVGIDVARWLLVSRLASLIPSGVFLTLGALGLLRFSLHIYILGLVAHCIALLTALTGLWILSRRQRSNAEWLEDLQQVDPKTGVMLPPVFEFAANAQLRRATQHRFACVLMLVEMAQTERSLSGWPPAQQSRWWADVADALRGGQARLDDVGRYGSDRFSVLVHGPMSQSTAHAHALRTLSRLLDLGVSRRLASKPKIRVAFGLVLPIDAQVSGLLSRLEAALQEQPPAMQASKAVIEVSLH